MYKSIHQWTKDRVMQNADFFATWNIKIARLETATYISTELTWARCRYTSRDESDGIRLARLGSPTDLPVGLVPNVTVLLPFWLWFTDNGWTPASGAGSWERSMGFGPGVARLRDGRHPKASSDMELLPVQLEPHRVLILKQPKNKPIQLSTIFICCNALMTLM